jgi:ribonuclease HI
MSRQVLSIELQTLLHKTRLNNIKLIDMLEILSLETLERIKQDIQNKTKNNAQIQLINKSVCYVFTDGACLNNEKPNARASFAVYFTSKIDSPLNKLNCVEKIRESPTNQKAELLGIQKALELLILNESNIRILNYKSFIICTDSMYSINCLTKWYKTWEKQNWTNSSKQPVKHSNIIKDILYKIRTMIQMGYTIEFKHVYSHIQEPRTQNTLEWLLWNGNNECDRMANQILMS